MPDTYDITPTKEQLAEQRLWDRRCKCLAWSFRGLLLFIIVGFTLLLCLEIIVEVSPQASFDSVSCEVLDVSHQHTPAACADVFTYNWKLADSAKVLTQDETRRRDENECLVGLDISALNATFQTGTQTCFRLKGVFAYRQDVFNCAHEFEANASAVDTCQSLHTPTSAHSALIAYLLAPPVIVCSCMALVLGPIDEIFQMEGPVLD